MEAKDYIPKQLARKVARPRLEHLMDPEDYGDVVVSDLFLCSPDANEGLAFFAEQLPVSALAKQFPGIHPLDWSLGFCQWQHVSKDAAWMQQNKTGLWSLALNFTREHGFPPHPRISTEWFSSTNNRYDWYDRLNGYNG